MFANSKTLESEWINKNQVATFDDAKEIGSRRNEINTQNKIRAKLIRAVCLAKHSRSANSGSASVARSASLPPALFSTYAQITC